MMARSWRLMVSTSTCTKSIKDFLEEIVRRNSRQPRRFRDRIVPGETLNTADMEIAIAEWVGTRTHLVVPNVSYGMYVHECDLFVLSKSGYATEIEIKITVSICVPTLRNGMPTGAVA